MFNFLSDAKHAGVVIALTSAGTLQATGEPGDVNAWLPRIRDHKAAIVEALTETRHWWRVTFPDLPAVNVLSVPGSTITEMQADYPTALVIEPFTPRREAPDRPLTADEERAIRRWLEKIKETDPATVAGVLAQCQRDAALRRHCLADTWQ